MTAPPLRLGTRGSALARWQAEWVASQLALRGVAAELVVIATEGDVRTGPIGRIGAQGVFSREIQNALLAERVDLAVHSLKDLPTEEVPGLKLAAVPERESSGDVLIAPRFGDVDSLPSGARIGSGSLRRQAQLRHYRSDLVPVDIRGNLDTRLRKVDAGEYDAILLAEAGLKRLGWSDRISQRLPKSWMLPAIGQGALGIEARDSDQATLAALALLNHLPTRAEVIAERALLAALRGGCLAPVGAWCRREDGRLLLDAAVLAPDGSSRIVASQSVEIESIFAASPDSPDDATPASLGRKVAEELLSQGAAALIAASRQTEGK